MGFFFLRILGSTPNDFTGNKAALFSEHSSPVSYSVFRALPDLSCFISGWSIGVQNVL